jgi:hypothetical protein
MENITTQDNLPPWPKYENDPIFRRWIDSGGHAPDYTRAWFWKNYRASKQPAPVAA